MYGLLIEAIMECVKKHYGIEVWEKAKKKAKITNYSFSAHQQYSETLFLKLCKNVGEIVNIDSNIVMELVGKEFITFISQYGYDRMIKVLGRHMRDFVNGIDNLHEYMRFSYEKMKPPSFIVEKETATGLVLHYRTRRKGLLSYFIGQIKEIGKSFYNLECKIIVLSETQEIDIYHTVMRLDFMNKQYEQAISSTNMSAASRNSKAVSCDLVIRSEIFFELFPFHLIFKKNLEIISIGDGLSQAMKNIEGESIKDHFNINRPMVTFTWDNILHHTNNIFELVTIEPVRRSANNFIVNELETDNLIYATHSSVASEFEECCLKLKGQMMFVKEWEAIIFLAMPVLENLDTMFNIGFYINDLSMHDSSRDLVLIGNQQSADIKLALDQEKQRTKSLEESMRKLDNEIKKTDQLLYQMIPKNIADRLRNGEPIINICEVFPICTILFSDVVGFTSTCSQLTPMQVVTMLNDMYTKFDKCLELHSVYKVETIGDAYMVVSGLPEKTSNHGVEITEMAFDMLDAITTLINPVTSEPMKIRVGCHSGPVVAGVVGLRMPRYCLFGDAVNTASRMESTSKPMKIHISHATKSLIDKKKYKVEERGKLEIKGKGHMKTYFVVCRLDEDGKSIQSPFMEILTEFEKKEKIGCELSFNESQMEKTNAEKTYRDLRMGFKENNFDACNENIENNTYLIQDTQKKNSISDEENIKIPLEKSDVSTIIKKTTEKYVSFIEDIDNNIKNKGHSFQPTPQLTTPTRKIISTGKEPSHEYLQEQIIKNEKSTTCKIL